MKKIQYELCQGIAEDGSAVLLSVELPYSESNLVIAQTEAYNGTYTAEEAEDVPAPLTVEERLAALEKTLAAPEYVAGTWYYRGDKVSFEGAAYTCIAPQGVVCVWSPGEYPVYWLKG